MSYYLAGACQNTFILFDCLHLPMVDDAFLSQAHRHLIEEGRDDALILMDGKVIGEALYSRMLVLGADGALAEFCGNGSRACASYLFDRYRFIDKFFLVTPAGAYPLLKHDGGIYSISLPLPRFECNDKFIADQELFKKRYEYSYVEMLEPHLLVHKEMSDEELLSLGRELNGCKELFPLGINVNAWHVLEEDKLYVKTYERGVQRLTRSCGTGSISCAAFYKAKGSVQVSTPGGDLEIVIREDGIKLNGPAFFYYKERKRKEGRASKRSRYRSYTNNA